MELLICISILLFYFYFTVSVVLYGAVEHWLSGALVNVGDIVIWIWITLLSVPGKVFATVLLNKVRDQLLAHRRTEQSGFTPGRSTIDRIVTLNTVIQTRKEFQRPIWIVFVDLKAVFDSVDRKAL